MSAHGQPTSLLDVVPWSYGFAHAWALKWLLNTDDYGPTVLAQLAGQPETRAGLASNEHVVGKNRADVAVELTGDRWLYVEIKVNDPVKPSQLEGYRDDPTSVGKAALYAPGLTGVLHRADRSLGGVCRLVTADDLFAELDVDAMPHLVGGYVRAARLEAQRLRDAVAAARAGRAVPVVAGETPQAMLESAIWLSLVQEAINPLFPDQDVWHSTTGIQVHPRDRTLMWAGTWQALDDVGGVEGELILRFVTGITGAGRELVVHVGGSEGRSRALATSSTPPTGRPWRRGRGRGPGRLWTLDVSCLSPAEAVEEGTRVKEWMASIAETYQAG